MEKTEPYSYTQFLSELEDKKKIEEKIRLCLDFMRLALSQEKIPAFRDFWQAKRLCLDFFKEKIPPHSRNVFWSEYVELSDEIRKVKEVLDEQSTFAGEQIELAIEAIEKDFHRVEDAVDENFLEIPKSLRKNGEKYREIQKELQLLNALAGRLNALRKELIHVNLRIKQKNRFFERLSKIGDKIFPRRKELIKTISEIFIDDIHRFTLEAPSTPYFERKEEIKALQNFAKILTLSTPAFSETRESLSRYWDEIRDLEKDQKQQTKQNLEKVFPKIEALKEKCEKEELSLAEVEEKSKDLLEEMKEINLGPAEMKSLKKKIFDLKRPLEEKEQKRKEEEKKIAELEQKRRQEAEQKLLAHLLEVLHQAEALPLDALVEKWEALVKEEKSLSSTGVEKEMLQNRLDALVDHIQEKKWQNLLSEENPEEIASSLHSLLDERHKARRKLKENLELHRKVVGGSSLNLEESMLYQEMIAEEKLRLDTVEAMIEEIEEKLFDLEE